MRVSVLIYRVLLSKMAAKGSFLSVTPHVSVGERKRGLYKYALEESFQYNFSTSITEIFIFLHLK